MKTKNTQFIALGKIAEFRNGLNFKKENSGKGCKIIGVVDFKNNFYPNYNNLDEINPKDITTEEDFIKKGDIIFVRSNGNKALVGRSLYIDNDIKALFSGFCIRTRLVNDKIDPLFLAYFTKTNHFKSSISFVAGTNINNLNQSILSNVKIPYYPKKYQLNIIEVLKSLDSKIELNNKINAELEAMAKLIYDYWFVQFDFPCLPENYKFSGAGKPPDDFESVLTYRQVGGLPVPDRKKWFVYVILTKEKQGEYSFYKGITNDLYRRYYEHKTGQGAKWTKGHEPVKIIHYEEYNTKEEAAKREKELKTGFGRKWLQREYNKLQNQKPGLPAPQTKLRQAGKMVWNDVLKREIPEGWEVGTLESLGKIVGGSTPSTKIKENFSENEVSWITPNDLSKNKGNKYIAKGALDVTKLGIKDASLKIYPRGTVLLTSRAPVGYMAIAKNELTTNQGFKSIIPNSILSTEYVYYKLQSSMKKIIQYSSGSTFKEISGTMLKSIKIDISPSVIIDNFTKKVESIFKRQEILEQENQELTKLRDWLLPMLMNGQVSVE